MAAINRWKMLVAMAACVLLAASCSATDSLLGGETEDTLESEAAETAADDVDADTEATGQENGEDVEASGEEPVRPSIWTRADDAAMRPETPRATMREVVVPGDGEGWTVVGSLFDYQTNTTQPAVWRADEPGSRDGWTRTEIKQPDGGSAQMSALARTDGFEIAVGSHGREREQRPAAWIRPTGGEWRSVDRPQFDTDAQGWFVDVAITPSTGQLLALGGLVDEDNKRNPMLWTSADGDTWEAVDGLPFATDGSEGFRMLATGPDTTVITGDKDFGSGEVAVAYWSDDGRTWTKAEVEAPDDGNQSFMGEATWFNDRFVAVGGVSTDGIFRPTSWISEDGRTWELQQQRFELNDDGRSINVGFGALRVTNTDSNLYATAGASFLQHIWRSSDGANWSTVDNIWDIRREGVSINSVAAVDDQIVVATAEPGIIIYEDDYQNAPLGQQLLPIPDEVPWVSDISHDGERWLAVGGASVRLGTGGTKPRAAVWTSIDGINWDAADRLPESTTGSVASVAPWTGGMAAVGTESIPSANARRTFGRGLLWQLAGDDWAEINPSLASDDSARIGLRTVTGVGDGLLAGGWRFAGSDDNTDAWLLESDGESEPVRIDIGHRGPDNERVAALCGNQSGEAVALVTVNKPETREVGALWRDPEGVWSDVDWPAAPPETELNVTDCGYGADGFLAAGFTLSGVDENIALWRSADGSSWEQVDGPPGFSADGNQWLSSLAVTETGYLLAGNDASSGEVLPVVWFGSGDDWEQVVIEDAATMTGLRIGFANGIIVVAGSKDGAVQAYSTTLDQLVTELDQARGA